MREMGETYKLTAYGADQIGGMTGDALTEIEIRTAWESAGGTGHGDGDTMFVDRFGVFVRKPDGFTLKFAD
jgi:hypothetical protein